MRKLVLLSPLLLLISCVANQRIFYPTSDLMAPYTVKPVPARVEIRILTDNRLNIEENAILFNNPRQIDLEGKLTCINSEMHYKKDSVVNQVTMMMVEHFNKARLFELSVYNKSEHCKYYLAGTLNSFYGEQEFSHGALIGSQFGLIGALATAGIKTPGKIVIDISDLKLFRKDGTLVKDFGSFYKEYDEEFRADGYCWCIFMNTNEMLKDFNTHLIEKIRADMEGVNL